MTGWLRPTRAIMVAGLLGGIATSAGIALTATSGWLIVRAAQRPVLLTLLAAIVAVRAFGMVRPVFRYLERLRSHDAALDELAARRTSTYAALIPLTPARLGARSRASVLTGVVDDLTDVVETQVRVTVPVLSALVAGVAATVLATLVSPVAGAILAGLLIAIAAGCGLAWRLEGRSQSEVLAARTEVQRVSDLVARQALELQAVGGEAAAMAWLDAAHDVLRRAVRVQSRGRALVAALILLTTGAAAALTAWAVDPGALGAPVAALLVVTPVAVGDALAPLADAMRSLARSDAADRRLRSLLAQPPAVVDSASTPSSTPLSPTLSASVRPTRRIHGVSADRGIQSRGKGVRLRGVTAGWTEGSRHVGPVDLDLPPGSRVALVGPNGSGKSTLLAVLARHLDASSGDYTLDDTDVRAMPLAEMRSRLAILDDEPHVFASSLRENLRIADPGASEEALALAIAGAGLSSWTDSLHEGLSTRLGTGGRGLSGGERARLGLARVLLSRRPIVLLDEPVAHLDHPTATAVLADVRAATAGRTLVLVSHRAEGLDDVDLTLDLGVSPARATRHTSSTLPALSTRED